MLRSFCLAAIVLSLPAWTIADVSSGPDVGTVVRPLKVDAVTGDQAGQELDYAAERGDKPTVYVFIHADKFDRPAGRYLRKLDEAAKSHGGKAAVVAVWLTDDKESAKTRLKAIQNSLQFGATSLAVYASLTELPDGWGLNTDAHLTAVVVGGKKVAAKFAYISVDETLVRDVAKELNAVVK